MTGRETACECGLHDASKPCPLLLDADGNPQVRAGREATPLIQRRDTEPVPPTWCTAVCEQGCQESWTVDVADFDPRPTLNEVEAWLSPILLAHEQRWHR